MGIKAKDASRLNKLIKRAGSIVGSELVTLEEVAEDRTLAKLLAFMDNVSQPPLQNSGLNQPHRLKEQRRKSFLAGAIRQIKQSKSQYVLH